MLDTILNGIAGICCIVLEQESNCRPLRIEVHPKMKDLRAVQEPQPQTMVPPYVPYRSFRNFLDSLKQGIPSRIDRSVMPSMSGALQSQLAAALRSLGMITSASQPTERLTRFVNSEGPERAKLLASVLVAAYPYLFQSDFDIRSATPRMLQEKFVETGASGGTVDKCVNFFLAAAKDAALELSPHLKNMRGNRVGRTRPRLVRDSTGGMSNGSDQMEMTEGTGDLSWTQMLLSKFPSFDPAWPDDVKTKWFDAFDKLMKQGQKVDME
jgi:hypothetical protein